MKFFTIQLAMVWLFLQATPHLVHGGGLRGLSASSAIDSTSNDSRAHDDRKHRHAQEEGVGDLATPTAFPGDMFPPGVDEQVDTNSTAVVEGDVIEAPLGDDVMGAPPLITPTSTEDIVVTTTTMVVVDEEAVVQEDVASDLSPVVQEPGEPAALSTSPDDSSVADIDNGEVSPIENAACTGGKAEVWVGSRTDSNLFSSLWVISSESTQHSLGNSVWKNLPPSFVPSGYKGDKNCAKFYSVGAGIGLVSSLVGGVNRGEDRPPHTLYKPVFVRRDIDPTTLKLQIDLANKIMNGNFDRTDLTYGFSPVWDSGGPGWEKFNSNGYIAGLMSFLQLPDKKPNVSELPGWAKPVPKEFFQNVYTSNPDAQRVVIKAHKCTGGKTEVWFGCHNAFLDANKWAHHGKMWVISSDANVHAKFGCDVWKDLWPSRVPGKYKGDKGCAKFFSVGGFAIDYLDELAGVVNRDDDLNKPFLWPVMVTDKVDDIVKFKTKIDNANNVLNKNFQYTDLEYEALPWSWNRLNIGWDQFNSNGYLSGLLSYLGYDGFKPEGGNLVGWDKTVPKAFFTTVYTKDADVKKIITDLHPPSSIFADIKAESINLSSTTDPMQLSTLDPTSASTLEPTTQEHDTAEPQATSLPTNSASSDPNIEAIWFSTSEPIDDPP